MARPNRSLMIAAGLLALAGLVSCHRTGFADQPFTIDWSDPIPFGVRLSSSDAEAALSFAPVVPSGVAGLQAIFVSDPKQIRRAGRSVAFVYKDQTMGTFAIEEWTTPDTPADFQARVQENSDLSGHEKDSVITLDSGDSALLAVGDNTTYVEQIRGSTLVLVIGPSVTFTPDYAVAVANKIA